MALGYMLMLGRHLGTIDRRVRTGGWPKPEGEGLMGKVLGLVGLGAIGRGIARRASLWHADPGQRGPHRRRTGR